MQKIELERMKQYQKIILFDPLNLRRIIPESLKPKIIRFLKMVVPKNPVTKDNKNYLNKYSTKNFYIETNNIEKSLDLLGICKK